jgi:poly(A) polymerase Pap1
MMFLLMKFYCQGRETTVTVEQPSHEFSEALSELEDEDNTNMSMSSNKTKRVRAQEFDGDERDSISRSRESMAPKRRRGKSVH